MRSFRGETTSHFLVVSDGKSKRAPHHRSASTFEYEMRAAQHRTSKMEFTGFLRRRRRFRSGKFIPVSRHGTRHLLDAGRFVAGSEVRSSSFDRFPVMGGFANCASVPICMSLYTPSTHRLFAASRAACHRSWHDFLCRRDPAQNAPSAGRSIT
jgi:hypothetical protein